MSKYERPTMSRAEYRQNQPQVPQQQKPKKKRRILKAVLILLALLLGGTAAYAGYAYFSTKDAADKTYDKKNEVTDVDPGYFDGKNSISILLLGTDTGAFDRTEELGRSDTMILATVNPEKKTTTLMSIPRDTMAEMVGDSNFNVQKINAAYSIGNAKMAMASVSSLVNVPVKYYAAINMAGLQKLVDLVGGVDVNVKFAFSYGGSTFKVGKMHLDGKAALNYARMRYDDPENDYGRQKRQREVIFSIVKSVISLNTVTKLQGILDAISTNVKTNLTFNNLVGILTNYSGDVKTMKNDYLHGTPAYIGDASYQVMKTAELQRISDLVRTELNLETETIDNNETYQNEQNTNFNWLSGDQYQQFTIYAANQPGVVWNGSN